MKYQIIYTKNAPTIAYRNTIEEARELAKRLERMGYIVSIWEQGADGIRPVNQ